MVSPGFFYSFVDKKKIFPFTQKVQKTY